MTGPASMNYNSLTSDVLSYVEKQNSSQLQTQLPRLIMLAENRLATDLKILGVQQVVTGNFQVGQPSMPKPDLWRSTVSFRYTDSSGNAQQLFLRTPEYCKEFWPNASSQTATPRFYADYNMANFMIVGTPSLGLAFELTYVARLTPLSDANQTNWYTDGAPQLLLAAALLETEIWLKNQSRIDSRQKVYSDALAALSGQDSSRVFDRSIVRM